MWHFRSLTKMEELLRKLFHRLQFRRTYGKNLLCLLHIAISGGGEGGYPIYGLYRYVSWDRVWFKLRFSVLRLGYRFFASFAKRQGKPLQHTPLQIFGLLTSPGLPFRHIGTKTMNARLFYWRENEKRLIHQIWICESCKITFLLWLLTVYKQLKNIMWK